MFDQCIIYMMVRDQNRNGAEPPEYLVGRCFKFPPMQATDAGNKASLTTTFLFIQNKYLHPQISLILMTGLPSIN